MRLKCLCAYGFKRSLADFCTQCFSPNTHFLLNDYALSILLICEMRVICIKIKRMKSLLTFFFLWILTMNLSYAQKIGLNITNPSAPIHMVQPTGTTLLGAQPLLFSEYTGTNLADAIAIKGKCKPGDYYGIGGDFEGGYVGVQGRITGVLPKIILVSEGMWQVQVQVIFLVLTVMLIAVEITMAYMASHQVV